MVSLNTGGLGVKLARAFKNNDPNLPAVINAWKKFGGSEKSLRKAAFRSKKARQLRGIAGPEAAAGAPVLAAILAALTPLVKALKGSGPADTKTGGDKNHAGPEGAKSHNYETGQTDGGSGGSGGSGSGSGSGGSGSGSGGSGSGSGGSGSKGKVMDFVQKYKVWLIVSVVGIIVIIAASMFYSSAQKKAKRKASALKGARTRKRNQKALAGYVGTQKEPGTKKNVGAIFATNTSSQKAKANQIAAFGS